MIVRVAFRRMGSRTLRWVWRCLVVTGLAAIGVYVWSIADAAWYQTSQTVVFREAAAQAVVLKVSPVAVRPAKADPRALGKLEIPKVNLAVVVREGIDSRTLRRAVGHVPGTALPGDAGNVVIAGHRDTFFRDLRRVERGDELRLTTAAGAFRYRVTGLKIVGPEAVDEMAFTSEPSLTLVTCFPFRYVGPATRRLVVRAIQD
ncbi:MAG: class D sortase [Bryobacterales bacterium]|nr:class D sortase [Bryobacterales bacterium]